MDESTVMDESTIMDANTVDISATVMRKTFEGIESLQKSLDASIGEVIDRLALRFDTIDPVIASQLIGEQVAMITHKQTDEQLMETMYATIFLFASSIVGGNVTKRDFLSEVAARMQCMPNPEIEESASTGIGSRISTEDKVKWRPLPAEYQEIFYLQSLGLIRAKKYFKYLQAALEVSRGQSISTSNVWSLVAMRYQKSVSAIQVSVKNALASAYRRNIGNWQNYYEEWGIEGTNPDEFLSLSRAWFNTHELCDVYVNDEHKGILARPKSTLLRRGSTCCWS